MEEWQYKRNAMNRYYASLGFTNINVNQKTFCEDAYGRERVSRGPNGENRNKLTTDATARLLSEIVTGIALQGMAGAKLWSKAGWTSTTRHDAAYVELPNGAKFVLVTFTTEHANEREIIPTIARIVIDAMLSAK